MVEALIEQDHHFYINEWLNTNELLGKVQLGPILFLI